MLLNELKYQFTSAQKLFPIKGNLVYEYNPFRNYRIQENMIYYQNRLWSYKEFCTKILNKKSEVDTFEGWEEVLKKELDNKGGSWDNIIPKTETHPIIYQKGQIVDFETDELNFDLNHPVNITPQWSFDNSVNLIINDGKNSPKLINSRFSVTERNKYQICDRKGNNDTNIYDQGTQFDIDTSLYKKSTEIPQLDFLGVQFGGNLGIGNYHFYFRYIDSDGNESDFFAESGLVSIFIGNTPNSIYSGFRNENSHKMVKFFLSNTDSGYEKVVVYYTKATSDIYQNPVTSAFKIEQDFYINQSSNTFITITGFENVTEVPLEEVNPTYQIYGSVQTQAVAQNMLFLGNVDRPEILYNDLADCALRFLPYLYTESYDLNVGDDYSKSGKNTYYDPNFIYDKVGYWDDEIYRFGVVFIQSDNTLTPVFNVRGIKDLTDSPNYSLIEFYKDDKKSRNYISYNEETFIIAQEQENSERIINEDTTETLENVKGVVSLNHSYVKDIIGINFKVDPEVLEYLLNTLGIKGMFFVRQKRIPTTLCQAYTIAVDKVSHTPVLPVNGIKGYYNSVADNTQDTKYITESFVSQSPGVVVQGPSFLKDIITKKPNRQLTHTFEERLIGLKENEVNKHAAICPDYDVNSPYLNSLFTGGDFSIRVANSGPLELTQESRHFKMAVPDKKEDNYQTVKILGVEDNVKLVAINDEMFSARAGEAEEAFRFAYVGRENKTTESSNYIRGSFGPYLGITGHDNDGYLIDIKIPGYNKSNMSDYFKIRYEDKSSYQAISDRIDMSRMEQWFKQDEDFQTLKKTLYRGDCYICQFTHRFNRNFQDPSAPINDDIVNPKCWDDNFEYTDGVLKKDNFDQINLGDVNAVGLGMWVTIPYIRSTMNLNVRAIDDSIVDETALTGHPRGFYPYHPITYNGAYKVPEALCYNKGFEKSLSERWNYEVPDVPWIKNEFSNRIAYSDIQVTDAFRNGFRTFKGTTYRDYPKTYGSITKLVELQGNLLCVFEHGVALIPVNERVLAGEGDGGPTYINTSNVLPENPKVISDTFGSQWRESIIQTPHYIYGVDTVAKKIWRTNGNTLECISDMHIQEFLNQNISLTERELDPIIGVRNVKAHYNKFKGDVMFTFYDNLHGFEEKVWNICFNEVIGKWITFYSWVPSYSENIYNQYFSFDRNTSKWIAKLGISTHESQFADGVTVDDPVITPDLKEIKVYLDNRNLPTGDQITNKIEFELVRDNYKNWEKFNPIETKYDEESKQYYGILTLKDGVKYSDLCSEQYARVYEFEGTKYLLNDLSIDSEGKEVTVLSSIEDPNVQIHIEEGQRTLWKNNIGKLSIYKDDSGKRINLSTIDKDSGVNRDKIVILLNIRAKITSEIEGMNKTVVEAFTNSTGIDGSYYESVVALIPEYNLQFLTTDFWKHGQAGIIDIADKIYPTYWYGKQHPFEFEFVVADNPDTHKIFDNLQIISNKAEPESFHYEIVGECYDFAKDKKNMYIRQEATKELYQYNGSDITFDKECDSLTSVHRPLKDRNKNNIPGYYEKSALFPLYYSRQDSINEVEDFYHLMNGSPTKDFSALSGAEIVRYKNLDEYRIWNHAKAVDLNTETRLRGNMQYKEDKWNIQINPINFVETNEPDWKDMLGNKTTKIPVELRCSPIPEEVLLDPDGNPKEDLQIPESFQSGGRYYTLWNNTKVGEAKLKDKFVKIRVRYSGKELAIISALKTLYSISYA